MYDQLQKLCMWTLRVEVYHSTERYQKLVCKKVRKNRKIIESRLRRRMTDKRQQRRANRDHCDGPTVKTKQLLLQLLQTLATAGTSENRRNSPVHTTQ